MFEVLKTPVLALVAYLIFAVINRIWFHPLSRFPGPRTWAISRIPYARTLQKGDLTQRTKELHDTYGDVVRIAPNELSFIGAQAWQDIYGHHQGRLNFPKNPLWMSPGTNGIHSIFSANDADHSRYRRLLSHAFSDKALRQQEDLILSYIELLISRLKEQIVASGTHTAVVDLVRWFNFTSFDIVGDLSFGESLQSLEESRPHEWVSALSTQFKSAALIVSLRFFPGVGKLLRLLLPKSLIKRRADHIQLGNEKIHRRLKNSDPQRNDFMTYILRHNDERGMSVPEIETTVRSLIHAGSETTATALSGITNCLLNSPDVLSRLVQEIRERFSNEMEITADAVNKLPFLTAVIEEGLRLCPPVALGMPRLVPPGGGEVCGHSLPGGTFVSAPQYASNRCSKNFRSPTEFLPSRWLDGSSTSPAFNPFSLGPRNCLGRNLAYLEMRLILAKLFWHFDIERMGDAWIWEEQKSWILWEKNPLNVKIRLRGQL